MADQSKKLAIDVLARVDKLEKSMAKAARTMDSRTGQMEKRTRTMSDRVNQNFSRIGNGAFSLVARNATLALAPILSAGAAIRTASEGLREFDEIAKSAKAGGLDPESYQELAYAMDLGGVATAQFAKSMETFAKNTGLAAAGKGRLITQLKALNPELLANLQATSDQEKRLRLVADALDNEADASKKAAIASALFGEAGVRMVEALKGGSTALDDTAQKARALGIVVNRDLIANAETLNDKFGTAQKVIDLQFKQALVGLAPWLVSSAELVGTLASSVNILVDQFKSIEDRTVLNPLQNQLAGVYNRRDYLADQIKKLESENWGPTNFFREGALSDYKNEFDDLTNQAMRLLDRITELQGRGRQQSTPLDLPGVPDLPGDSGSRGAAASAAIKQAETVAALVENLKFEQAQLGRTAEAQELYNALKQAGVDRESAFGVEIENALVPLQEQRTAIEKNAEAMRKFEETASGAMSSFIDDMLDGKNAGEAFGRMLGDIASQLLTTGVNGLSGLIGGKIFPHADGGIAAHGKPKMFANGGVSKTAAIFGEAGPEAAVPLPDGRRIPVDLRLPQVASGGGGVSVPINITIDATGADAVGLARLQGSLAQLKADIPNIVKHTFNNRRGGMWGV